MDSENFIVTRSRLVEQLQARRARDLASYPFHMMDDYGIKLPAWARLVLSFVTRGGSLSRFLDVGLPLAVPYLFKKQLPLFDRIIQRIFSPKS
jgi:hypothetical protein